MRKITTVVLLASVTILSACAGFVVTPVPENERDLQNTYDGRWSMSIAPRTKIAKGDRRPYHCLIAEDTMVLNVQDGIANIEGEQSDLKTNVSTDGRFRLEMPTDQKYRKKNGLTGINSMLTVVYKGTLSEEESIGVFVHGRGYSQKTDCSTTMVIKKLT